MQAETLQSSKKQTETRLASIDVLRALTMFLMIFVNDLWSLDSIPKWLGHAKAEEDYLGFSDVIFPAFLFIVGLSIPLALQNRIKKGDSTFQLIQHIALRSIALLVMGFFHVNLENYSQQAFLPKPVFQILITIGFFLVWLDYPKEWAKVKTSIFQWAGIAMLAVLAVLYKGDSNGTQVWMQPQWWGILGLIGWSYLVCSLIYVFSKGNLNVLFGSFIIFLILNAGAHLNWFASIDTFKQKVWLVGDGSLPALVMAGAISSIFYLKSANEGKLNQFILWAVVAAAAFILAGYATRPLWAISKIRATFSWTTICTGFTLIAFAVMIFLTDLKGKTNWFSAIKAGGTSTLTCYLLPYIHYAIYNIVGISLPLYIRSGAIGIFKCLIYSFIIIQIAHWLGSKRIKLKI